MVARRVVAWLFAWLAACAWAQAPSPQIVRVTSFDGGWNLPLWVAQRQGFSRAHGVSAQLQYTSSSAVLVTSMFDGGADVALALIDNLVAYQEGQGAAKIPDDPDLFAFMGGDGGFLSVVASPGIRDVADLIGRTLSVDAMATGAAFVLREVVARHGIGDGDVNYVSAAGTANREVVEALLLAHRADTTPALARRSAELLLSERGGIAPDLAIDPAGMRTVLALRARHGTLARTPGDPAKYLDTTYLDKALGTRRGTP